MSRSDELLKSRREKLHTLRSLGIDPFGDRFERTHTINDIKTLFGSKSAEELEDLRPVVRVAGRVVTKRVMGKASFCHIQSVEGQIQLYVRKEDVTEREYTLFRLLDLGDFIGVEGRVFRTNTGELTIWVKTLQLLTKSLAPLPDKYAGLSDVEDRYRKRYLDLISNEQSRQVLRARSIVVQTIREFLNSRGFLEVETPVMLPIASGATARPFITYHNALGTELYLRIAMELHLKRLIVGGFEKVYEIGRVFRNEGISTRHNPEFTMMELYQAYADFQDMARLTQDLIQACCLALHGTLDIYYQGHQLNLGGVWRSATMAELVREHTGIDFMALTSDEQAREAVQKLSLEVTAEDTWGTLLVKVFEEKVASHLIQPTFVTMHPVETSPLAKRNRQDPRLTDRFELYVASREVANAFSELNDPIDQRQRFEAQARQKAAGNEEAMDLDEDFLYALEIGMPPTGGLGIGVDRLVMILTDAPSIRDVILFPTLKPRPTQGREGTNPGN